METMSYQNFLGIDHRVEVRINVTNACNLHCDYCDHDAHLPFDKNGPKIFRVSPLIASPDDVERFCQIMIGVGENDNHVLQGGEITVLPVSLIMRYIDVIASYGRRVGMRTNGYNLSAIPLKQLQKRDFIYLNAHGNNTEAIKQGQEFLKNNYSGRVVNEENLHHRDLSAYINHNEGTVDQGLNCSHLMATLTLISPVVHPCCNSWALMNALNSQQMKDLLIKAGWTSDNPDLKNTLANWRQTLPQPFLESFCANSCYLTASRDLSPSHLIQSDAKDRVIKWR
jgi:molybdenum cofactor biosynthesis enzyme MoaA